MAKKVYEEKNISAIAEAIRAKTGGDTTYKTSEMPEGVNEVYEAGQKSMVDESKIIEKSATGTNFLFVDDVSELPHEVEVQLSSDTIIDFSGVELKVQNGNLIPFPYDSGKDVGYTETMNGITYTVNADRSITVNGTATVNSGCVFGNYYNLLDGDYCLSANHISGEWVAGVYIRNTVKDMFNRTPVKSFTSPTEKLTWWGINVTQGTTVNNLTFKPMLNVGSTALPYLPYEEATYLANADGSVGGVKSLSPSMNFFAEGVSITAKYHKSNGMQTEYDRFWDAIQDNGNKLDYFYCFAGYGWDKGSFRPKYDLKGQGARFSNAFNYCLGLRDLSLIDILNECGVVLDTSGAYALANMFGYCFVTEIPHIDCSGVRTTDGNRSIGSLFNTCNRLRKVEKLTLKEGLTYNSQVFQSCVELAEIEFAGVLDASLDLHWSTKLTHDSLMSLLNILKDFSEDTSGTTYTITIGSANIAKLTEAEMQIAYDKGWNIL